VNIKTLLLVFLLPAAAFAQTTACQGLLTLSKNSYSPKTDSSPLSLTTTHCLDGRYRINIFNAAGEHILTLKDIAAQPAGTYSWPWDGTNKSGEDVASGVYIIRFTEPQGNHKARVILVR